MADGAKKAGPRKPLCFVIGPIGKEGSSERKHSDLLLDLVIKEVLQQSEFGYTVKRADEDADPGMIGDRMISDLINAELVVADLTDLNPNAFYELGIRHLTKKPTIHIAKVRTILPFDTSAHRTIFVDLTDSDSIKKARAGLAESARAIAAPDYRVSNPITQANVTFEHVLTSKEASRLVEALLSLTRNALTFQQASELIDAYLSWTRAELTLAIGEFFERDFEPTQARALVNEAEEFTDRTAMEIIQRARATLQSFKLSDDMNVARFLDIHSPIENGIIAKAKQDILKRTKDAIEDPSLKRAARTASVTILHNASMETTKRLTTALEDFYHRHK